MHSSTILTLFLSTAIAAVLPRDDPTKWTNPNGGNSQIFVSDNSINWGTTTPRDVLQTLEDNCSGSSCDPSWTVPTSWIANGVIIAGNLKVTMQDDIYQLWAKNGLVEVLQATMDHMAENKPQSYTPGNGCFSDPDSCLAMDLKTDDQWWAPQRITIRVEDKDGAAIDDITVFVEVDNDGKLQGLCNTLGAAGAAVAGAINGVAGGAFSLLALACQGIS